MSSEEISSRTPWWRWLAWLALGGYLALLFDLTMLRFHQPQPVWNFVPGLTILHDFRKGGIEFVINFLGNLAAFLPFGFLLPICLGSRWDRAGRVALASFGLSLLVEVSQGVMGTRVADVDDLTLNTVGGLIGFGSYRVGLWLIPKRRSGSGIPEAWHAGASKTR